MVNALVVEGETVNIYNEQFICLMWVKVQIDKVTSKMLLSSYLCECVKSNGGLYSETLSFILISFFFGLLLSFNHVLMHECSSQRET